MMPAAVEDETILLVGRDKNHFYKGTIDEVGTMLFGYLHLSLCILCLIN